MMNIAMVVLGVLRLVILVQSNYIRKPKWHLSVIYAMEIPSVLSGVQKKLWISLLIKYVPKKLEYQLSRNCCVQNSEGGLNRLSLLDVYYF